MTDTSPPTLVSVWPSDGSTNPDPESLFILIFDEPIGSTPVITLTSPSGSTSTPYVDVRNNIVFVNPYNFAAGVWTLTVQDGTVKDTAGNVDPGHITFSPTFTNGPDTTPPQLVTVGLASGDTRGSVTPGSILSFYFSEFVNLGSGSIELHLADGTLVQSISTSSTFPASAYLAAGGWLSIWGLDDLHPGTNYYINFPAGIVTDASGNPTGAFTYTFTTSGSLDVTRPTLVSSAPSGGELYATVTSDISLMFSEPVKLGTGNIAIYRASDHSLVEDIAVSEAKLSIDATTVTVATGIVLDPTTQYYVLADPGIVLDTSDNAYTGISDPIALAFTTEDLTYLQPGSGQNYFSGSGQMAADKAISVTDAQENSDQFGLYLNIPAADYAFFNYGSISGTITAQAAVLYGVVLGDGTAQIYNTKAFFTNEGVIQVSGNLNTAYVTATGPVGDAAVGIGDDGGWFPHIINGVDGTIDVTAWNAYGILIDGTGNPVNDGTISVRGTHGATGLYSGENLLPSFTNTGLISVNGSNGSATFGLEFDIGSFTLIDNSGNIEVTTTANFSNSVGIQFNAMSSQTIVNSGNISAGIAIYDHDIGNGSGSLLIANTGTISGDIHMGAAISNTFDGRGGVFNGTIYPGRGTNVIYAGEGDANVAYIDPSAAYSITSDGGGIVTVNGPSGTATLSGIQKVIFKDRTISLSSFTSGAYGDLNGDGHSDLLFQNSNGQVAAWMMYGATTTGGSLIGSNPGPNWQIKGTGDFNLDGDSDILWQNTDGTVAIWEMNGTSVIGGGLVGSNPGPSWQIKGTGDFNGDGNRDVLWQATDGTVAIWELNGTSVIGGGLVGSNPGPNWHVISTGDFNGDGDSDIFFQNSDGTVAVWLMNGTTVIGGSIVGSNPGPSWHVLGAGDFDGDGKSDILLQNDSGQAAIWLMNGTTNTGGGLVGNNPGPTWQAKGTGDYNGDGMSDILWQNTNGTPAVWLMNGTSVIGGGIPGSSNPGTSWHLIAGTG